MSGRPDLVFADEHLLVVDKPAGLLSVPGRGALNADCVSARLREHFPDALIVHRLDMATSGLLMFARGTAVQRAMGKAFESRSVSKRYVAVVHGAPDAPDSDWSAIDLPIGADWADRPRRRVDPEHGKPSLTRYRVMAAHEAGTTRLLLEPLTGRTHQLRVHLSAIGHPIVGDALYGHDGQACPRLLLHACGLRFRHPASGEEIALHSEPPF